MVDHLIQVAFGQETVLIQQQKIYFMLVQIVVLLGLDNSDLILFQVLQHGTSLVLLVQSRNKVAL